MISNDNWSKAERVLKLIRTTKNFPSFSFCQTLEFWKHHKFPRVVCSTEYWNDSDMPLWKLFSAKLVSFAPTVWTKLTSEFAAHKNRPGKKKKGETVKRKAILDISIFFFFCSTSKITMNDAGSRYWKADSFTLQTHMSKIQKLLMGRCVKDTFWVKGGQHVINNWYFYMTRLQQ